MGQLNLKNCVVKIKDGTTPTAKSLTIKIGDGNITYSEKINRIYTLDRGNLDDVRDGDDVPMEVKMEFIWEYLVGPSSGSTVTTGAPTVEDVLKKRGPASTWVSTDSDTCRPFAVDIEVMHTPDCTGDKETYTFPDFRYEDLEHDFKGAKVSCTGKCNATEPVVTRASQS